MSNILIGKTITALKIADDRQALLFSTNEGDIEVLCDADCCSNTWVEHIEVVALGLPAEVISVVDLDMPDLGDMPDCDVVTYYGLKIVTNKGEIIIDYRNDSNGYYGGNLTWPGEYHYGGVHGQNDSSKLWIDVLSDI